VRFQSSQQPALAGSTINHRVAIVDHALRAVFPDAPAQVAPGFQKSYWKRAPMDLGRPLPTLSRLRVEDAQTNHRATLDRPGRPVLVQFSHFS
jgi:hypothetical protein